ncbi:MAG: hypothetical protein AVDCRST_MAG27-4544, partial [uncultured Craurococcus sp.]
ARRHAAPRRPNMPRPAPSPGSGRPGPARGGDRELAPRLRHRQDDGPGSLPAAPPGLAGTARRLGQRPRLRDHRPARPLGSRRDGAGADAGWRGARPAGALRHRTASLPAQPDGGDALRARGPQHPLHPEGRGCRPRRSRAAAGRPRPAPPGGHRGQQQHRRADGAAPLRHARRRGPIGPPGAPRAAGRRGTPGRLRWPRTAAAPLPALRPV